MLVALPFSTHDQHAARKTLQWIADLGGCEGHDILLVVDEGMNVDAETSLAEKSFDGVDVYYIDRPSSNKWPIPQNHTFRRTVDYVDHFKLWPMLFMESDAIPLKAGWLDAMQREYERCGKPFMGYIEYKGQDKEHMNGVGIYSDVYTNAPSLMTAPTDDNGHNYMAFDLAGAADVVRQCHASPLFQFQYQQEEKLLRDETLCWLNPDSVIFHTEKTGRLIDLLRARKLGAVASAPAKSGDGGFRASPPSLTPRHQSRGIVTDVFVKTYPADAMWHEQCRKSYDKYCSGFRAFVDTQDGPDGYLGQQVVKLNADLYTDADYILVTDSDTLWTKPVTPQTYFRDGKPIWFLDDKASVLKADPGTAKWFRIMEEFLGEPPDQEFMRRQPFLVPRWLLQAFRAFCWHRHGKSVEDYVMAQKEFSEWNCLGFYAWTFHNESFAWRRNDASEYTVKQFWSAHHFPPGRRQDQFNAALPEIRQILGESAAPAAREPAPKKATKATTREVQIADGWNAIASPERRMSGLLESVVRDHAKAESTPKKMTPAERMAHARAHKKKK